jgi:hypothetical protein
MVVQMCLMLCVVVEKFIKIIFLKNVFANATLQYKMAKLLMKNKTNYIRQTTANNMKVVGALLTELTATVSNSFLTIVINIWSNK